MKAENNRLPDFLLADLYKNSLVIMEDEIIKAKGPVKPAANAVERAWFLGNNQKKITILVDEQDAPYLPDDSLQFLSSILGACKLNLGDVAIVNYHNDPLAYASLKEKLTPASLILFGVSAKQLQLPFMVPHYQVQKYDHCTILLAPKLDTMLGNNQEAKLEKSKLWLSLKNIFGI